MKIEIDIPEPFEGHFKQDRFKDSLERFIIDAHSLAGNYEIETAEMLIIAFQNATLFPEHTIDRLSMLYEIYMEGVNMCGEYQGCWVRFKDIEEIVNKYMKGDNKNE